MAEYGLHHGSCFGRHAAHGGRNPTVSTGGLLQSRYCTQRALHAVFNQSHDASPAKPCTVDSTMTAAHCRTGGLELTRRTLTTSYMGFPDGSAERTWTVRMDKRSSAAQHRV
jgi:hypothetical protein